jgi:transcriptional regulator GlxA family with amidase domain
VWTSAGVSAGIDMTLAFIAEVAGADAAGRVQFGAEYYPVATTYGDYRNHAKAPRYVRTAA